MIRSFLFAFACFMVCATSAQIAVFKTVEDFRANEPDSLDGYDFDKCKGYKKDNVLVLKDQAGHQKEIACADIWGIRYKGELYRVVKPGRYYQNDAINNVLVRLEVGEAGKLCFYEYGMDWMKAKSKGKTTHLLTLACPFASSGVDGDLVALPLPNTHVGKDLKEGLDRFFDDFPQYKSAQPGLSTNTGNNASQAETVRRYNEGH